MCCATESVEPPGPFRSFQGQVPPGCQTQAIEVFCNRTETSALVFCNAFTKSSQRSSKGRSLPKMSALSWPTKTDPKLKLRVYALGMLKLYEIVTYCHCVHQTWKSVWGALPAASAKSLSCACRSAQWASLICTRGGDLRSAKTGSTCRAGKLASDVWP